MNLHPFEMPDEETAHRNKIAWKNLGQLWLRGVLCCDLKTSLHFRSVCLEYLAEVCPSHLAGKIKTFLFAAPAENPMSMRHTFFSVHHSHMTSTSCFELRHQGGPAENMLCLLGACFFITHQELSLIHI